MRRRTFARLMFAPVLAPFVPAREWTLGPPMHWPTVLDDRFVEPVLRVVHLLAMSHGDWGYGSAACGQPPQILDPVPERVTCPMCREVLFWLYGERRSPAPPGEEPVGLLQGADLVTGRTRFTSNMEDV